MFVKFLKEFAVRKKIVPLYLFNLLIITTITIISVIRPYYQGLLIDNLGTSKLINKNEFIYKLVIFLFLLLISYVITYVQKYISSKISEEVAVSLREKINNKLETINSNYFNKNSFSNLLMKIDKDVLAIKQCGITSIINLFSNIVTLLIIIPYMLTINKAITFTNIFLILLIPIISKILGVKIQKASKDVLDKYSSLTSSLSENYNNWFIIRLLGCYEYSRKRFLNYNIQYKKSINKQNYLYIINSIMAITIQFMGTVVIWLVGASEAYNGNMTIGTILALMNYQAIIATPIIGIAAFSNEYHTSMESLKDLYILFDYDEISKGKIKVNSSPKTIELINISFCYSETQEYVLSDINMNFIQGNLYSIYGKSGEGKSTLFKIIAGILTPSQGKVLIDGIDLQNIDLESYWEQLGYVMQRSYFFEDSIINNLNIRRLCDYEEVNTICERLELKDMVESLDEKWNSSLNVEGNNFSEGQLRRMDISRTLLMKPSILILDEVTANIDEQCRKKVWSLISDHSKECITIFTTHNQNEFKNADIVYKLNCRGNANENWSNR